MPRQSAKSKTGRRAGAAVPVPGRIRPLLEQLGQLADARGLAAYAVGGCVRDWLLGKADTIDLDVMVEGDGIAFANDVAAQLACPVASHQQFGTATLMVPPSVRSAEPARRVRRSEGPVPLRVDIASCRKETYAQPAAYPKVSPGRIEDDLFRRDFTINAMALAITPARFGELVDPFGGLDDLQARRLRVLHARSFVDDPSRILRAARFAERFGCTVERKTAAALQQAVAAKLLERLNRGRLRKELERLVEEPDPVACLARLGAWLASPPARRNR